ncbi:SRPBCC family protein [Acidisoma silvae]|uniref:SRPBCC domain-containing protein n=1 Tax=Acidisoma silvae TaxID=2802396 RepID=A0A963YS07_9PROT|nr:SRPBCC domain-containing protein [Acidisoma silvae]MCB8876010.1 SRPBCC domain-containing protein [Acidisoma silvae]
MTVAHALKHEISISASVDAVYAALSTASGLKGWNTPSVDGSGAVGSIWTLHYAGRPDFCWRIDISTTSEILWTCTKGPGDAVGTTADFTLTAKDDSRTLVRVTHGGWPHDEANFIKCNTIWGALMDHLREFVHSGKADPAFS